MVAPFGLTMKRKRVDLRILSEHLKRVGNEILPSNGSENLTRKIELRGSKHD